MNAQIKDIPNGELFKRKEGAKRVYIRGMYCRQEKRYSCTPWDDASGELLLKGGTVVFIGFTF